MRLITQAAGPLQRPPGARWRSRVHGRYLRVAPRWRRSAFLTCLLLFAIAVGPLPASAADPCAPPVTNPIVCENSKPGAPASEWDISGAGDPGIQGFATDISVDQGQTAFFKVSTAATKYRLDLYRMGYYAGAGARKVATVDPTATLPQSQPACLSDSSTGLVDCGNWAVSASWAVPVDATSGIYFAKLVREDGTAGSSHVFFIVRDDDGRSDLLFQTSDTTWQAYNRYGGNSLYVGSPANRAYKVSYNRPFTTRSCCAEDWVFNAEYPMVRWLEANGYNVSYFTDVDTDRRGGELLEHKAFLSVGHDEYWSAGQRANVEAARDAGVHLAFFSGNEVFWKTRWETSIDGSGTPHRTLVSYKETHANKKIDPDPAWTGTWRDPRFSPPADGGRPENALSGTIFMVNGTRNDALVVPAADGKMRFWRNTTIASLSSGQSATLPSGTLGYEWDEDLDNGSRPAGIIRMSSTTVDGVPRLQDYGSTYQSGTATHHLTLYRNSSGALVFGAGTVQWSWGLDANHDRSGTAADARMQQATVNLLADMGVQPATLQSGLVAASASTDTAAPTSTIAAPSDGATVPVGSTVSITGTATDLGGVVGGVEVSVDGGSTWHPAAGRSSWSYSWVAATEGTFTIRSRAADDSGNLESPSAGVSVTVGSGSVSCPCSLWSDATTPAVASASDTKAVELGVRFRASQDGAITGVRFYKGSANTGTHVGSLWSNTGTLLASATFANETASGWQTVSFATPVAVTAGVTYLASYHAPVGGYAKDISYFAASGYSNGPLQALQDGVDGGNGAYRYSASPTFPTYTYASTNYWVDVVFATASDTTAPTVTATSPTAGATGVAVGTDVTATFSEAVDPASIGFELRDDGSGTLVSATKSYDSATRTATLNPGADLAAGATYKATVSGARDSAGNTMTAVSWSFTTAAASSGCPCSLWSDATTPAVASASDTKAVELGVRFRASQDGAITGVRFYKGSANTGTHVGSLWSNTGTLLASATFANETASGWQTVSFASPVAVTAGVTYLASYHAPVGGYAKDISYFAASGYSNGPLQALQDGVDGGNGAYRYSASPTFPTYTYKSTNYWVDVVFTTTP